MVDLDPSQWYLKLTGQISHLQRLANIFGDSDISVFICSNEFYLTSSEMQSTQLWYEVMEIGKRHLHNLIGAYALTWGEVPEINLERLIVPKGIEMETIPVTTSGDTLRKVISTEIITELYIPRMKRAIEAASRVPTVKEVLDIYARGVRDYVTFYKIFEIIRDDLGGGNKKLTNSGLIDKSTLSKVTLNLNHPQLSGDMARHARMDGLPEKDKLGMTLTEVEETIGSLVHSWIEGKLEMNSGTGDIR